MTKEKSKQMDEAVRRIGGGISGLFIGLVFGFIIISFIGEGINLVDWKWWQGISMLTISLVFMILGVYWYKIFGWIGSAAAYILSSFN